MNRLEIGKIGASFSSTKAKAEKAERIAQYKLNPKLCGYCSEPISEYEKRYNAFCSRNCSAKFNNANRERDPKHCLNCGLNFSQENNANKYCRLCVDLGVFYWKYSSIDECRGSVSRRNFLIRKHGHRCSVCNMTEWCGQPIPIELDHINGNSTDNSEENLRLICPNCHAQTPTYKGKNKGNGRKDRRDRWRKEQLELKSSPV